MPKRPLTLLLAGVAAAGLAWGGADAQTLKGAHPYLTFSDTRVQSFKARVAEDPQAERLWSAVQARAQAALAEAKPAAAPSAETLTALALSYRMTKDRRYALKARDLMAIQAAKASWVTDKPLLARDPVWNSDLGMGTGTYAFGLTFDAIHDALTPQERKSLAQGLAHGGIEPILGDWVDGRSRIHSLDTMGHNWWSHIVFGAGVAAIAIQDDEPRAKAWVQRVAEAEAEWFAYAGSGLETKPSTFGADGAFTESINYADFAIEGVLRFRRAWSEAYREAPAPQPLLAAIPKAFLHSSYPNRGGLWSADFGDGSFQASGANALLELWGLGQHDRDLLWYIDKTRASAKQDPWARADHLVLWPSREERQAAAAAPDLPLAWADRSLGLAALRSSWADDATFLALRSGFTWNHNHADAGSFVLWHGGAQLVIDSGNSSYARPEYDAYYRQSLAHNVVTLDGRAEPASNTYNGSAFPGRVDRLIDAGALRYVLADATGPNARDFERKFRSLLWIGDVILVIDDVKGWAPGAFEWLLHYEGQAVRTGQVVTIRKDGAELAVQPLYPQTLPDGGLPTDYPEKLRYAEGRGLKDHAPDVETPYMRLQAPGLAERAKFIVALTPRTDRPAPRLERFETKDYLGVRIRQGAMVTDVYLNLLADGRVRHRNANATLGAWDTDAYLLAVTYPEGGEATKPASWFVADASYLRRPGDLRLDSLSKVFASVDARSGAVVVDGQPVLNARLACAGRSSLSSAGRRLPCVDGVAKLVRGG